MSSSHWRMNGLRAGAPADSSTRSLEGASRLPSCSHGPSERLREMATLSDQNDNYDPEDPRGVARDLLNRHFGDDADL